MNTAHNIIPIRNPLATFKALTEEIRSLEKAREVTREEIFRIMDLRQKDTIAFGDLKAERSLVVQERIDSGKVRTILGNRLPEVMSETEVVRLKVI